MKLYLISLASLVLLVSSLSLAGVALKPAGFTVLTSAAGPAVSGGFSGLDLSQFVANKDVNGCSSSTPFRSFLYQGTGKVSMFVGTQTYTFLPAIPAFALFKTKVGCLNGDMNDTLVVGEFAFANDQFVNVKVIVNYTYVGNLQIAGVPNGVLLGKLNSQP